MAPPPRIAGEVESKDYAIGAKVHIFDKDIHTRINAAWVKHNLEAGLEHKKKSFITEFITLERCILETLPGARQRRVGRQIMNELLQGIRRDIAHLEAFANVLPREVDAVRKAAADLRVGAELRGKQEKAFVMEARDAEAEYRGLVERAKLMRKKLASARSKAEAAKELVVFNLEEARRLEQQAGEVTRLVSSVELHLNELKQKVPKESY